MSRGLRRLAAALPGGVLLVGVAASGMVAAQPAPQFAAGAAAFAANCGVCHGSHGAGQPGLAPPLTHNPARYAASVEGRRQLAMTVLYGMYGDITIDQKHYNFKMPEFSAQDDAALSAVLNYVVFDLASAPADIKPITPEEIAAERDKSVDGAAVREHRAAVLEALGGS
jgi:mono/diheme cytochrome c family protein